MHDRTRRLWDKQEQMVGDRRGLFGAVARAVPAVDVLYPGSYVDLTPSFIWPRVTYVDVDKRADQFFGDREGIDELLAEYDADPEQHTVEFLHRDYTARLDLPAAGFDLLISLYAGFVSEYCTEHVRPGGFLLVAPSHGDVAMASIDDRYRLWGVIETDESTHAAGGGARVVTDGLDAHLVPKRPTEITVDSLHESGRGVPYTTSPFAYLFQRQS